MANKNGQETTSAQLRIALKDILADKAWNARSGNYESLDEKAINPETGQGFAAFLQDIKLHGVETPVEVIPNPDKATAKKHPWFLVTGFRRFAASEKAGFTDIPAVVKDFDPYGARIRNLNENVNREGLKGADLAFGIADIFKMKPSATEQAVASEVGINQSYLNKLKRIMQVLPASMTEAWRAMPENSRVKVLDMYKLVQLADKVKKGDAKPVELEQGFAELEEKAKPVDKDGPKGPAAKKDKLEAILGQAEALGKTVGVLASLKAVTVHASVEIWENVAKKLLRVPADKTTAEAMRRITSALAKGYEDGKEAVEEDEEDEEAEEVENGKRGRKVAQA